MSKENAPDWPHQKEDKSQILISFDGLLHQESLMEEKRLRKGGADACDAQASVRAQSACFSGVKPLNESRQLIKESGCCSGSSDAGL